MFNYIILINDFASRNAREHRFRCVISVGIHILIYFIRCKFVIYIFDKYERGDEPPNLTKFKIHLN